MVHFSRVHLKDDFILAQRADALYEALCMVVSAKKRRNVGQRSNMRFGEASFDGKRESWASA